MLDKILILMHQNPDVEFSSKRNFLLNYGDRYEMNTKNALLNFKNLYIESFNQGFIFIWMKDFTCSNPILKKIINKHKIGFWGRFKNNLPIFYESFYETRLLFLDKEFLNYFDKHQAFLDFDFCIFTTPAFLYNLFSTVERELGKGEDKKDFIGEKLFLEINNTLLGKSTYSGEIEIAYIFVDFIKGDNRYIYFLLKELEEKNHLKIKSLTIKENRIKFIIMDLTEIKRDLFTSTEEQNTNTNTKKNISEYKNDKFKICDVLIPGSTKSLPGEIIFLFYKLKNKGEYSVDYSDMISEFLSNKNDFHKINASIFSESVLREKLRPKNNQISEINDLKPILNGLFFICEKNKLRIQK